MRRLLCVLCVLCGIQSAFAVEREALTFTKYDLRVHLEPTQQGLEAHGTITLRNDSNAPQKYAVLQISSSLEWQAITFEGKKLAYVGQPYTSDVDHTGAVNEAIVTLPRPLAPHDTVELGVSYSGTIALDVTRVTRTGTSDKIAARGDWDTLAPDFSAVRGIGHVVWYPVAIEAASLSNGEELWDALARWRQREAGAQLVVGFHLANEKLRLVTNADPAKDALVNGECPVCDPDQPVTVPYRLRDFSGVAEPVFVLADYRSAPVTEKWLTLDALPGGESVARQLAQLAALERPVISAWLGEPKLPRTLADMASRDVIPAEADGIFLMPFAPAADDEQRVFLAHQLAHAAFRSPRPWMQEGLARFAELLEYERQGGRAGVLKVLGQQLQVLAAAEDETQKKDGEPQSLITSGDELFYGAKAQYVWWMLRDVAGDEPLKRALAAYRPEEDKDPAYFQRLLETEAKKQLEWFFDDWVYRDRGLPDFRVVSAFPRQSLNGGFLLTVTVENLGAAGAEVPVIVHTEHGTVPQRVLVPAHDKVVVRITVPEKPVSVDVNDGSVPESDVTNNTFDVPPPSTNP